MKIKIIFCLALVLSGDLFGCATTHSAVWEYIDVKRLDYPGLNNKDDYKYYYAWPWKEQLNVFEQQGWSVDHVSIITEGLTNGYPTQEAIITLKRAKK